MPKKHPRAAENVLTFYILVVSCIIIAFVFRGIVSDLLLILEMSVSYVYGTKLGHCCVPADELQRNDELQTQ